MASFLLLFQELTPSGLGPLASTSQYSLRSVFTAEPGCIRATRQTWGRGFRLDSRTDAQVQREMLSTRPLLKRAGVGTIFLVPRTTVGLPSSSFLSTCKYSQELTTIPFLSSGHGTSGAQMDPARRTSTGMPAARHTTAERKLGLPFHAPMCLGPPERGPQWTQTNIFMHERIIQKS